jgi:hypothetical protein
VTGTLYSAEVIKPDNSLVNGLRGLTRKYLQGFD